jgi:hypothetical protein
LQSLISQLVIIKNSNEFISLQTVANVSLFIIDMDLAQSKCSEWNIVRFEHLLGHDPDMAFAGQIQRRCVPEDSGRVIRTANQKSISSLHMCVLVRCKTTGPFRHHQFQLIESSDFW